MIQEQLKAIHAKYCTLTGQELKYGPAERMLWDFINNSFTEADLEVVLTFLIWQNKKREPRYRNKIQFHRIVGDLEYFNSILGEASAWSRNRIKPSTAKAITLAAFRGEAPQVDQAGSTRSMKDVLKGMAQ